MKLKCTYIGSYVATDCFVVGNEYEIIGMLPQHMCGIDFYDVIDEHGAPARVALDNLSIRFIIMEDEEDKQEKVDVRLKCTYNKNDDCIFTVGNIYEGRYLSTSSFGEDWYEAKSNRGNAKILLDGSYWKFEIVKEAEEMVVKETLTGLEAIELMKQGKMIIDEDEQYQFKIIDNNIHYKYFNKNDSDYLIDCSFNFSILYKEYIAPKTLTGWERVDQGAETYFIGIYQGVDSEFDWHDEIDARCFDEANYFSTREKAEEINFKQTLFRKLQRFSDENGGNEIDWNNGAQAKYCIAYHHGRICVDCCWLSRVFGQVYFISEEVANKAIELFHDDLVKYFTM